MVAIEFALLQTKSISRIKRANLMGLSIGMDPRVIRWTDIVHRHVVRIPFVFLSQEEQKLLHSGPNWSLHEFLHLVNGISDGWGFWVFRQNSFHGIDDIRPEFTKLSTAWNDRNQTWPTTNSIPHSGPSILSCRYNIYRQVSVIPSHSLNLTSTRLYSVLFRRIN